MARSDQKYSVVDAELNSTEIGQFVAKHKIGVVVFVICIFLGVFGWGIGNHFSNQKNNRLSSIIFKFESKYLKSLEAKEIDGATYLAKLDELYKETGSYPGTLAVSVKTADLFIERGDLESAKQALISSEKELIGSNPFINWFIFNRLAVVYEDLKQNEKAVEYLKKMNSLKVKLLEPKVYLDLGRIYLRMGKKEDASINLKYVVDNFSDSSFAKIAKLYLNDIK